MKFCRVFILEGDILRLVDGQKPAFLLICVSPGENEGEIILDKSMDNPLVQIGVAKALYISGLLNHRMKSGALAGKGVGCSHQMSH